MDSDGHRCGKWVQGLPLQFFDVFSHDMARPPSPPDDGNGDHSEGGVGPGSTYFGPVQSFVALNMFGCLTGLGIHLRGFFVNFPVAWSL
jgi:hypothetical protein